jgi:hypothetical protein
MGAKESTARFYFNLTYILAKEDITKMRDVEKQNLYLCLSIASLIKDENQKARDEMRKIKNENNRLLNNYR